MAERVTWTNEKRRLGDLLPWPRNPRTIKNAQAERLVDSVETFGQVETLAIGPGNEIYNGHQRLSVLRGEYGADYEVDVRVASRVLTEKEREKLTIYLHKGAAGEWDFDTLANEFEMDDLLAWGFEPFELGLSELEDDGPVGEDPGADVSKADELQAKWDVQLGDLWQLGDHRLICGDCTDEATVARVMGGEKADMMQTDPPYGVDYSGQNATMYYGKNTKGKERTRIDGDATLENAMPLIVAALRILPTSILFLWHAPQFHSEARQAVDQAGYELFSVICWNKNHANFGAMGARYKPKFEMALACKVDGIPWYGPDNEVTVWDVDRYAVNEFHPTQKPPELFGRAVKNHTEPGQIVADPFSGSGTTIIACEQLGRRARAIELHPPYVAVALQRWADMTGKTPVRIESAI